MLAIDASTETRLAINIADSLVGALVHAGGGERSRAGDLCALFPLFLIFTADSYLWPLHQEIRELP